MERFSLLLLEPGEIYFEDFAVVLHPQKDLEKNIPGPTIKTSEASNLKSRKSTSSKEKSNILKPSSSILKEDVAIPGRLKICSKSLVFVPAFADLHRPMVKFPLNECQKIEEYLPTSFRAPLASEQNLFLIRASSFVEMLEGNVIAPFKFIRGSGGGGEVKAVDFVLTAKYGNLDDRLAQIAQLKRASTLPPVEQNGMIATIVYSRQNRLTFDTCWLESVKETILLKTVGNKVTPLVVNPGRIVLTDAILYFQPYNNAERDPVIRVRIDKIKRLFQRRYLLRPLGLEIDYVNKRAKRDHIYLTFNKPEDRQLLYHKLIQQKNLKLEDSREDHMTLQWQHGLISNFDYLLYLNSAADRSFNDLTQYPVFPWVIADYTSDTLDLTEPATFRDLSKPMGALNDERLEYLKKRREDMPCEKPFLYGSHYSTPGFVLYFLVRQIPECMLCLQNGRFDHPDRMFNSLPQTWINVTTHHTDFKELVPEFYMPENEGSFLVNQRDIDFGERQCGRRVSDVGLPPWADGPADLIQKFRDALEGDYVSEHLHQWIDLIFGFKQRGKEAEKADNVFFYLCYEGSVDLDAIRDLEDRYALEIQIGEFGQVPKQIFNSPHPQKLANRVPRGITNATESNRDLLGHDGSRQQLTSIIETEVGDVKFWDNMMKLRRLSDYKPHREAVSAVSVSVDNLCVFSAAHDELLKMYSIEEMKVLRSVHVPDLSISCTYPLPNNRTVLLGSRNNSVCAYSIEFGRTAGDLCVHGDAVSCMDWHSDLLATGSWDSSVKLWHCGQANGYGARLSSADLIAQLQHNSQVTCLHLAPDKSQMVAGTREGNVVLWCLSTYGIIQELPAHRRQVNAAKFSPDGTRVASVGSDFYMKVIDLKTGSILFSKDLGEELNCLAWDGRVTLVGGGSGALNLWDLHRGRHMLKLPLAHDGPVTALAVSQCGQLVVTGGEDRRVVVWTTKDKADED